MNKDNDIIAVCQAEYLLAGVSRELRDYIEDNLGTTESYNAVLGGVYEYCINDPYLNDEGVPKNLKEEVKNLKEAMKRQYADYFYIDTP